MVRYHVLPGTTLCTKIHNVFPDSTYSFYVEPSPDFCSDVTSASACSSVVLHRGGERGHVINMRTTCPLHCRAPACLMGNEKRKCKGCNFLYAFYTGNQTLSSCFCIHFVECRHVVLFIIFLLSSFALPLSNVSKY